MGTKNKNQVMHWVSGKGGVGKSTVAAGLALQYARQGTKTLLVELGDKSFFRYIYGVDVEHTPKNIEPNLDIARWNGEDCLKEYLLYLLKLERVVQLFFDNRVMKSLVGAAPGLRELALAGKITSGVRGVGPTLAYDCLVVDGFSTGHFRTLIESPGAMAEAIPLGPMGEQSRSIVDLLSSPKNTFYHIVATPEELPVTEGLELCEFIKQHFSIEPEVILNRFLDPPITLAELRALPQGEFNAYLECLLERQDKLWDEITSAVQKSKKLPYSWEFSARERIERISHALGEK